MKLYYSPGACSLASHITLEEAGSSYSVEKVDIRAKKTESGNDFLKISPRGAVPTLEMDGGEILTEGVAIMQYIMDSQEPGALPAAGSLGRARLQEALNFVSTEIHKNYAPFFYGLEGEAKAKQEAMLKARLKLVEDALSDSHPYVAGADFTPADAYFFTVTNWSKHLGIDMSGFPKIAALRERVAARPSVQKAMKAEGLI